MSVVVFFTRLNEILSMFLLKTVNILPGKPQFWPISTSKTELSTKNCPADQQFNSNSIIIHLIQ